MYSNSTGKHSSVTGKKSLTWLNEREGGDSLTQYGSRSGARKPIVATAAASGGNKDQSDSILHRF